MGFIKLLNVCNREIIEYHILMHLDIRHVKINRLPYFNAFGYSACKYVVYQVFSIYDD